MNPLKNILLVSGAILFITSMSMEKLDGVSITSKALLVCGLVIIIPGLFLKDKSKDDNHIQ